MIPESIQRYLKDKGITFKRHPHPRAVSGQALAAALHVTGYRVAKSVVLRVDGRPLLAVLAAPDTVDTRRLAQELGAQKVEWMDEEEFAGLFPECEVGAEPPFGRLFGIPVVYDESLRGAGPLLFRAGSHEEALEMKLEDFLRLESPRAGSFVQHPRPEFEAPVGAPPEGIRGAYSAPHAPLGDNLAGARR